MIVHDRTRSEPTGPYVQKHSDVILAGTCYDVITDTCHDTTLYYDVTAGIDYYVTLQLTSLLTPTVASRYITTPLRVLTMTSYLF